MSYKFGQIEGVEVQLNEVMHVPNLESPPDKPHPFVYFITILNNSDEAITIKARKWVVKETAGETLVVEGKGVVGQTPEIMPGDEFSYNSYHTVASDASVQGAFFGVTDSGTRFYVPIPDFELTVPG
ncbi:ApaG protein [Rubritalea squalenifaciens DSM 18772]|uniref:ApaG protein n=2 Tax=Rubritalea TaxID=361050 RepID=A0A1M6IHX5_9BACT|nr:ApaG domain [Rubritalea squalenifaciens]SHJ34071.1 ApaG protein [Rubritalea squalenifaciens DSM 18772]